MPLYEYHCHDCQNDFELLVRASERPACPKCGREHLEKLLSVPAAHSTSGGSLPVCGPMPQFGGGCGLPACGSGRCAMEE